MTGNRAPAEGRAGIEAELAQSLAQGSAQLTLHPVATERPTDGWAIDEGWYEMKPAAEGAAATMGAYLLLARKMEDGSWKIHRSITNNMPAPTS
jgi:ketosteroid isomerase-like protein